MIVQNHKRRGRLDHLLQRVWHPPVFPKVFCKELKSDSETEAKGVKYRHLLMPQTEFNV